MTLGYGYEYSWNNYVVVEPIYQDDKTVNFSIKNIYPGTSYIADCQEKNVGTVPAVFDYADVTIKGSQVLINNFQATLWFSVYYPNGTLKQVLPLIINVPIANLENSLNSYLSGVVLQPGEYLTTNGESANNLTLFTLSPTSNNTTQNESIDFSIQLSWRQL